MARNINENVINIDSAPKKRQSAKAKAAAEAARLAADESRGLKGPAVDDATDGSAQAYGHNGPAPFDEGVFLRWVQKLNAHENKGDLLKLSLKNWRTERKLMRKDANGDGIVLGQMDEALEDLKTEQVDIAAREQRRRDYHAALGIPFVEAQEMKEISDPDRLAKRWYQRGEVDGRLAKVREVPEGCPPECIRPYLSGHEAGTKVFLQSSPLTRDGFDKDGNVKAPGAAPAPADTDSTAMLTLNESHFVAGTELEDANLKSLLGGHHEAFHNATNVIAVFGHARRILKERDADAPDGFYIDDGSDHTPVTDPEFVAPAAADLA